MRYDFYHLSISKEDDALPKLLGKILQGEKRAVIVTDSIEHQKHLDDFLWSYEEDGWLPHGTNKDGFEAEQPLFLTTKIENPNSAEILVLLHGIEFNNEAEFTRILDIFDGNNPESLAKARLRWKSGKEQGFELHYWQQTKTGWEEKNG